MSISEKIADFVGKINSRDIPDKAIENAKNAVLDWIGVTILGSEEPGPKVLQRIVKNIKASEEAGIICGNFKTSVDLAAWVNGTSGHALDFDDTFPNAVGYNFHPSASILPAVLALGEKLDVSGEEILSSYIIGFEIEAQIGNLIGVNSSRIGWHTTSVIGTIGAAMACAHLLRLDVEKIQMAMGIASSLTGGLSQNFGTMTKSLHAGNSSRNGVIAALLAQSGFTGSKDIMGGERGFLNIFSGGKIKGSEYVELGERWHIISPGVSFKPYPCCRSTHSSIDASLYLKNIVDLHKEEIVRIICKTNPDHTKLARFYRPMNGYEGKFSIPYCIAASLIRGKISQEDFTDEKVNDPDVQILLSKVEFEFPEEFIKEKMSLTQEVIVEIKDKGRYSRRIEIPKGEPENPMTEVELKEKFTSCSRLSLSQIEIEKVIEIISGLESVDHISELMKIVSFPLKS